MMKMVLDQTSEIKREFKLRISNYFSRKNDNFTTIVTKSIVTSVTRPRGRGCVRTESGHSTGNYLSTRR